jgi:hypothetical protein
MKTWARYSLNENTLPGAHASLRLYEDVRAEQLWDRGARLVVGKR